VDIPWSITLRLSTGHKSHDASNGDEQKAEAVRIGQSVETCYRCRAEMGLTESALVQMGQAKSRLIIKTILS